jgi:hypothetical protein
MRKLGSGPAFSHEAVRGALSVLLQAAALVSQAAACFAFATSHRKTQIRFFAPSSDPG